MIKKEKLEWHRKIPEDVTVQIDDNGVIKMTGPIGEASKKLFNCLITFA